MLCRKPFMRVPVGVKMKTALTNFEARDALTPFGCGQCTPCRINKSRVWQTRLFLENRVSPFSCFVTLTYDEDHLPDALNVLKRDVQLFLKRLRKALSPRVIRYYIVGEYGSRTQRPHYHAMLFNVHHLEEGLIHKAWGQGFVGVGEVTQQSIAYVCKYVIKGLKRNHKDLKGRNPEFMLCSKKDGGIGKAAVLQMARDLEKSGHSESVSDLSQVMLGRRRMPLGRYLTNIFEERFPHVAEARKSRYFDYQLSNLVHLEKGALYRDSLIAVDQGRAQRMEALEKVFRKKESI